MLILWFLYFRYCVVLLCNFISVFQERKKTLIKTEIEPMDMNSVTLSHLISTNRPDISISSRSLCVTVQDSPFSFVSGTFSGGKTKYLSPINFLKEQRSASLSRGI